MSRGPQAGFSLAELLVSLALLAVGFSVLASLLVQNARANRGQQITLAVQANARNSLGILLPVLRSAGWDPRNFGIVPVTFDVGLTGDWIQVRADLDEDGDTDGDGEEVTVRFAGDRIEWKRASDVLAPWSTVAVDISNDADGDGAAEAMFLPDSWTNPTRIRIQITSQSSVPDPATRRVIRYTAASEILLRRIA